MFQRKFQFVVKDVELWYVSDITNVVDCCVTLHNMMVEERLQRDENELNDWYDFNEHNENTAPIDPAVEFVERYQAETELHQRLMAAFYDGPAINVEVDNLHQQRLLFNFRQHVINRRWECLYDETSFFRLRNEIVGHLNNNN